MALMQAGCVDPLTPAIGPVLDLVKRFPELLPLDGATCGEVWDDGTEYPLPELAGSHRDARAGRRRRPRSMWGTDWPWFEDRFKYQQSVNSVPKHAHYMNDTREGAASSATPPRASWG